MRTGEVSRCALIHDLKKTPKKRTNKMMRFNILSAKYQSTSDSAVPLDQSFFPRQNDGQPDNYFLKVKSATYCRDGDECAVSCSAGVISVEVSYSI